MYTLIVVLEESIPEFLMEFCNILALVILTHN